MTRFQFLMNRHLFLKIPLGTLTVKRPAEMLSGKEFFKLHLTKTWCYCWRSQSPSCFPSVGVIMVVHALGHLHLKPKNHFSLLFLSSPRFQLAIFSLNAAFFSIPLAIRLDQGPGHPPLDFQKGCLNDQRRLSSNAPSNPKVLCWCLSAL